MASQIKSAGITVVEKIYHHNNQNSVANQTAKPNNQWNGMPAIEYVQLKWLPLFCVVGNGMYSCWIDTLSNWRLPSYQLLDGKIADAQEGDVRLGTPV
jgi:hypothetical protein